MKKIIEYQIGVDVPDYYVDIATELKKKADDTRKTYIRTLTSGNAAVAKLEIDGKVIWESAATSKKLPLNIPGEAGGTPLLFAARRDRVNKYDPYNEKHAEYKLFNALAEYLTNRPQLQSDVASNLYLYTELQMCTGCYQTLVDDFQERFPNITVRVFWEHPYP